MSTRDHRDRCHHCGADCFKGAPQADGHVFCCQGCLGVYELIRANDACRYYDFDELAGRRPGASATTRYSALDLIGHAMASASPHSGIVTLNLRLPDMHCAGCVWLLERLHRFDPGVIASRVDLLRRSVSIDYRRERTSASSIARLLDSLGYPPSVEEPSASGGMLASERRRLHTQLGVAGFAAGNVMMIGLSHYVAGPSGLDPAVHGLLRILEVVLSTVVLGYCAQPWLRSAWGSLRRHIINLDVPISIGILTLYVRSMVDITTARGEGFLDSFTGLVFFLLIGRLFQQRAFDSLDFGRTMRSFFPMSATRIEQGAERDVAIDDLQRSDEILVRNSEVIPADAILLHSAGVVDYTYLTGESEPVECRPGTMLYAGGRVMGRSLRLSVVKPSSASTMAELWSRRDIHTERRAMEQSRDRFGLIFTLSTLLFALAAALLWLPDVTMALTVFSSVLIIACPCALTLAMPITYGTAVGLLAGRGIFLKSIGSLSELQKVTRIHFDKTGTLTAPRQVRFIGDELSQDLRAGFAALAAHSTHPVSRAIVASGPPPSVTVSNVEEIPGVGIQCQLENSRLGLGSTELIADERMRLLYDEMPSGSVATVNGRPVGRYMVFHELVSGVARMIASLRRSGLELALVSGDSARGISTVEQVFDRSEITLGATPQDKVDRIHQSRQDGHHVLMVGDGLNDIAAMSAANVSIAVSSGSSRIVPACDVMIDAAGVVEIDRLLSYARSQKNVVKVALWFTMVYNALGFLLASTGHLSPVITAVMMPLSSLLVTAISVAGARMTFRRCPWE